MRGDKTLHSVLFKIWEVFNKLNFLV